LILQQLIQALPRVGHPPEVARERAGVRYVADANPSFIDPTFEPTRPLQEGTSVLVISAPAAVGKSTLAEELARRTGAPLWDLAHFNVGDGTFEGTLAAVYGMNVAAQVVAELGSGDFLLIIDALDEGELRAGGDNFEAFLRDLATAYREPRARPTLVLLARAETAELISLAFELEDVPFARLQIDFFDQEAAYGFIDKRLDAIFAGRGVQPAHRVHVEPFTAARTYLVELVADVLAADSSDPWASDSVRTFLGYAPVLEAVAVFLSDPNYQELVVRLQEIRAAVGGRRATELWRFLIEIVAAILAREQAKIGGNVRGQLEQAADRLGWDGWAELYTPDEQCARVVNRVVLRKPAPPLPVDLPDELRGPYEDALQTSVPQHPFLGERSEFANVVFREYLYAWTLRRGSAEQASATRARMSVVEYLATPLLARFLLALDDAEIPTVSPQDFGFVYESLRGQGRKKDDVYLTLTSTPDTDEIGAMITAQGGATPDVAFRVYPDREPIVFLRRLASATVDVDADVALGTEGPTFFLGPDVDLACETLAMPSPSYRVTSSSDEGAVTVTAADLDAPGPPPQVTHYGDGQFEVDWPDLAYPWIAYRRTTEPSRLDDDRELIVAGRYLSRILSYFRSRGYGGLGRHSDIIDNFAVGQSELAAQLRDYMIEVGLIRPGAIYILDLQRMDELGINWADIRTRRLTDPIRTFLTRFLAQAHLS
jgi:hypothetical protein